MSLSKKLTCQGFLHGDRAELSGPTSTCTLGACSHTGYETLREWRFARLDPQTAWWALVIFLSV